MNFRVLLEIFLNYELFFCILYSQINMMLRINNLVVPEDSELQAELTEYRQLIKTIGKTVYSAIKPIMLTSSKDIWKMNHYMNK